MTENKRFELNVNPNNQCDIVDWVKSKEKNAICIYNDLGSYYFSSAKALCELLNELYDENKKLKNELNLSKLNLKEKNEGFDKIHKMYMEQIEENKELKSLCKVLITHIEKNSIAFVIDEDIRRLLE